MKHVIFALLAALLLSRAAIAEDKPAADKPAADKPAASQPASKPAAGAVVEVTDLDTIKANVGKELAVHGKVSGTFKPRSGSVILINFEGVNRDFVAVVDKADFDA